MARRKSSGSKSGGSTLFGLLAGLIIGLAAAAAVAYFVTQVPMPFVDKASRDPANILLPDVRDAPDPNLGLYGQGGGAGSPANGPTVTPPAPLPGTAPSQARGSMSDEIGALLETLSEAPPGTPRQPPPPAQAQSQRAPSAADIAATTQTTYFLQAGAFRSGSDAEAVKAQILMMGLPVQVQQAQVNGSTIHRVRVGPFKGIDEMNRSRVRLGEAKIESTVVRP